MSVVKMNEALKDLPRWKGETQIANFVVRKSTWLRRIAFKNCQIQIIAQEQKKI